MLKFITVFLLLISIKGYSQNDLSALKKLASEDSSSIPILFSYPDSIRDAILIASTYPQGFLKLEEIQKVSSESFKKLISKYNRTKQNQLWEITRYPELANIVLVNNKNESELQALLKNYPKEISRSAVNFAKSDAPILIQIENLHKEFETKYKDLTNDFPIEVKNSFNTLLKNPEIVSILTSNFKSTVILGDLYKRDQSMVKHFADSLNKKMAKENDAEYEEWKSGIKKDTSVQKDLKKIADQYEKDDVYRDDNYKKENYNANTYQIRPYPYWVGYPYWLPVPYWYPYPWWYNSGFYWALDGTMFFLGMPTYNFGWWYYNQPYYFNNYPRATNYFRQHYEMHERSNQGFNRSIGQSQNTRPVIKGKR